MATLTVQVPGISAEVLEGADGALVADSFMIPDLVRATLARILDELSVIVEGDEDLRADDIRSIAASLERLAPLLVAETTG